MKRFLVNSAIVALLVLLGWYCFVNGKAYDIILENVPYKAADKEIPALEAVNVIMDDNAAPVYLLEGDRVVGTAVGMTNVMRIDLLDMDDTAIPGKSRIYRFSIEDLGEKPALNVPHAYEVGQPLDK